MKNAVLILYWFLGWSKFDKCVDITTGKILLFYCTTWVRIDELHHRIFKWVTLFPLYKKTHVHTTNVRNRFLWSPHTLHVSISPCFSVLVLRSLATSAGDSALPPPVSDFRQAVCGPPHVTVFGWRRTPKRRLIVGFPEWRGNCFCKWNVIHP